MIVTANRHCWALLSSISPFPTPKYSPDPRSVPPKDVVLSFDGQFALSGSWDGELRLWDLSNGTTARRFVGHTKDVLSSAASSCSFEVLDLSANNFSEALDAQSLLLSCDNLMILNLSKNFIPSGSLKFGSSLLQLDLSRNRISDKSILIDSLSNCQNLNLLNFSDNRMTGKFTSSLSSCNNMSTFSSEIPPHFVENSPGSLIFLDLSHNNFTGDFVNLKLGTCHNLTVLDISHNSLSGNLFW